MYTFVFCAMRRVAHYLLLGSMSVGFVLLNYHTPRQNLTQLIALFAVLFACFFLVIGYFSTESTYTLNGIAALLFRVVLLGAVPNLSDDIYRFLWDGTLSLNGIHPFANLPHYYLDKSIPQLTPALYEQLNSPHYYTIYPSVCQALFWLARVLSPNSLYGSIVVLKLIIIAFEVGSMVLLVRLLKRYSLNKNLIWLYALNPLVIIELTGNIHFEAAMIFFLLFAFYLLETGKWKLSAIAFVGAVATKIIPLLLLPLLFRKLGLKRGFQYCLLVAAGSIVAAIPLFYKSAYFSNFLSSFTLYFKTFEFNASFYYLLQYLQLNTFTTYLPLLVLVGIAAIAYSTKWSLAEKMLLCLGLYLLCSRSVHPWYVAPLVALCPLTRFRFPVIWSTLLPLTYITYTQLPYAENVYILLIEYSIVLSFVVYELYFAKQLTSTNTIFTSTKERHANQQYE